MDARRDTMTTTNRLRLALKGTTALAAALMFAMPALAQSVPSIPDTGNVTVSTLGLGGAVPGSTNPTFTPTQTQAGTDLRVDLRDNRTILNWGGNGFNIAQGSSVNFKDARATAGVTNRVDNIAVLNRDLSGSRSSILGSLKSDANVGVYVINREGVTFGPGSRVSTGSFFASDLNLTDDNDFLNASTKVRFSSASPTSNGILFDSVDGPSLIETASNGSESGGRMGDMVLLGSSIRCACNMNPPTVTATGGDIGIIVAGDVTVQQSAGSPLSFVINSGTLWNQSTFGTVGALQILGVLTGNNITLGAFRAQRNDGSRLLLSYGGSMFATGAMATDRGIVLTSGVAAPGVAIADGANLDATGSLTVYEPEYPEYAHGGLKSDSDIVLSAKGDLFSNVSLLSKNLSISAEYLTSRGDISTSGVLKIYTSSDGLPASQFYSDISANSVSFGGAGEKDLLGELSVAGDAFATGGRVNIHQGNVRGNFSTSGLSVLDTNMTVGGSVFIESESLYGSISAQGPIVIENLNPRSVFSGASNLKSASDITIRVAGEAEFSQLSAGGSLQLAGGIFLVGKATAVVGTQVDVDNLYADVFEVTGEGADLIINARSVQNYKNNHDFRPLIFSATRDIIINANDVSVATMMAGRDIEINSASIDIQSLVAGTGSVDLVAEVGGLWAGTISAATSVTAQGAAVDIGVVTAPAGNLTLTATNGTLSLGRALTSGNATLSATGDVTISGPVTAAQDVSVRTTGGKLDISGAISASRDVALIATRDISLDTGSSVSGRDITVSGFGFINSAGPSALEASGHWVVYSAYPYLNAYDGLDSGQTALWNATLDSRAPSTISGNRYVFAEQPTLTFSFPWLQKTYGNTIDPALLYTVSGFMPGIDGAFLGDTAASAFSGAPLIMSDGFAERAPSNGGATYGVELSTGSLTSASGYKFAFDTSRITVNPRTVTLAAIAYGKEYDGTTLAVGSVSLVGVLAGDDVSTGGTVFSFLTKDAGVDKAVYGTGTALIGASAGNYVIENAAVSAAASITRKPIYGFANVNSKQYDGSAIGSGSVTLSDIVSGDYVYLSGGTFTFSDKNAGVGKVVTVTGASLQGTDSQNYTLAAPITGLGDILKRTLSVTVLADTKVYDGSINGTGRILLTNVVTGDAVETAGSVWTFVDKNVGLNKTVFLSGTTLVGADSENYSLSLPQTTIATITQKAVGALYFADSKVYDGATSGTGTVLLTGLIRGDSVGTAGTVFNFSDKNAGTGKTVSVTGTTLTGTDAGNYSFVLPTGTTVADIYRKSITAAITADGKVYDGTTAATGTLTLNGLIQGDSVGTAGTVFSFADKNAGTGKTVTATGTTLTGADSGNYELGTVGTATADIFRKAITGSIAALDKTYDGLVQTNGSVTLSGVIVGDAVGTDGSVWTFADKNAGVGKTVTVNGTRLSGEDAGNYTLTLNGTTTTATIFKRQIGATVTADSKVYDGTTAATGTIDLYDFVEGDQLGTTGTVWSFDDKNAGARKTVRLSGTTLTGADAGNYSLDLAPTTVASISRKALNMVVQVNGKTYDGTTAATGTATLDGVIAGETVGLTGTTLNFADKNAGTGKAVTVSGATLTGADSGNYTLALPTNALGDIFRKAITGSVTVNGKTYDGTTAATGSVALSGVVQGDQLGTAGTLYSFADKNAGTGKTVTISGTTLIGADAGNYTLTLPASAVADIMKRGLTGTIAANDKGYDGSTAGSGTITLDNVIVGDAVGTTGSVWTFDSKNAGTGKTVTLSGTTLTGDDAANYTLTLPATALADIMRKALTGTVTADAKTYDGTTAATGTVALNGVVQGDQLGTAGSVWRFADKNAGTGKTVTLSGTVLNGADAGNYTLTLPGTALADILKRSLVVTPTVAGKVYDGTTGATGTVSVSGAIQGDDVGITGTSFAFADKNAGTGKTVNVIGTSLTGADAGNYALSIPATVLGDIFRRALTGSVTANGKTYDGTTTGSGTVTLDGVLQGDQVGTTGTVWTFSDKNAGTGKVVTISGTTLNGVDGGNYTVTLPASAFADILKKAITGTVTVTSRQYDGTADASGTVALNGVVQGDQVGTTGTVLRFADANAGTGKAVSVSGTALTGADAGNYTLTMPAAAVADILKRAVSVKADDASKIRDEEDPLLTFTLVSGTLVAGDQFSGNLSRAPGERPGRYAISIGSLSLGGNYEIAFTPGTFTINLDPASDLLPPTLRALFLPSQIQADPNGGGAKITIDRDALCGEDANCTVH
ncbi:hypothetical protein DMC47_02220 [Nostoc sp. 3335mG]|nr:hypothetical protein DMC47_02220 [Nostoc sp. 3335mG]